MADVEKEIRRDALRRPVTWLWVGAALLGVVLAFFVGDALDPLSPAARHGDFDRAFDACVRVETELNPHGIYREDIGRHYDPEGICYLVAAYDGRDVFTKNWNDPAYVQIVLNIRGE